MWKLLNKLFGWDYVLMKEFDHWVVKKIEWIHDEPYIFVEDILRQRIELDTKTWKPLTPKMFQYTTFVKKEETNRYENEV